MRHLTLVLICLALTLAPYGLLSLMALAAPPSEDLIPLFAFSIGAAALGLALSIREWLRARMLVPALAIVAFAVPFGVSALGHKAGIEAQTHMSDIAFCGAARRDGLAPIPQAAPRYKPSLDLDGDGLACERDPNNPYSGRD